MAPLDAARCFSLATHHRGGDHDDYNHCHGGCNHYHGHQHNHHPHNRCTHNHSGSALAELLAATTSGVVRRAME